MVTSYESGAENIGTNEVATRSPYVKSDTTMMNSQTKKQTIYSRYCDPSHARC